MIVVATFENHLFVELVISALREKGVPPHHLFAVPLDGRPEPPQLLDTIHRADGLSFLDLAAIFGTCFMLLGSIYGYVLTWGPIIWGVIGAVVGISFGLLLKWGLNRNTARRQTNRRAEIVLLIRCDETQWPMIERLLWNHHALGLAGIDDEKRARQ
ncbi:hypothetical protein [Geobacillus sp. C56-T2]|uniref:hypothetical protein n=1 Tax=Geobacillus sp. C56-T2 TaxID=600773 RepID=UPI0011A07A55|nr:hypothetical protein [Geobacillus sp. C56-T2]NNV07238.1 hypothetical protein [Geobacillus sp. MMMUD3]TWG30498.1 hypothetical protein GC56T2_1645 [Geobacillus sp. C56-T2]